MKIVCTGRTFPKTRLNSVTIQKQNHQIQQDRAKVCALTENTSAVQSAFRARLRGVRNTGNEYIGVGASTAAFDPPPLREKGASGGREYVRWNTGMEHRFPGAVVSGHKIEKVSVKKTYIYIHTYI